MFTVACWDTIAGKKSAKQTYLVECISNDFNVHLIQILFRDTVNEIWSWIMERIHQYNLLSHREGVDLCYLALTLITPETYGREVIPRDGWMDGWMLLNDTLAQFRPFSALEHLKGES